MNNYNKLFGSALMLASAAMMVPAQASEVPLSEAELQALVSDIDVPFSGKGFTGIMRYRTDGNVSAELTIGFSDQGKWWMDGNQICTKWERLRYGKEACFFIYPDGEKSFRTSHGYTIHSL